jgi:NADH-quinone oxidoreductase subunit C
MASKKMEALGSVVEQVLGDKLVSSTLALDELTIVCKAADLTAVATTLRDHAEAFFRTTDRPVRYGLQCLP